MRLAFVIPWRDRGRWLWEFLPPGVEGELVFAAPEAGSTLDRKRLPPYVGELVALARRRPRWNDYDVVFTWELRSALAYAILRRLTGQDRAKWVAVGPILKGSILRALPVVRALLAPADRIVCFSSAECDEYARLLRLPRSRFLFLPTPWRGDETPTNADGGFILALGQSNRDYPTLLRAVAGTDLPLTLVAANASALGGVAPTGNVQVRYNTGHHETNDLIAGATLHCIPLHAEGYSAGQTVLLRAMAQGKAVVVSDTSGVRDYAQNGVNAALVPPGDADALRDALTRLWNDREGRERIGKQAAQSVRDDFSFARFTARLVELAQDLRKG